MSASDRTKSINLELLEEMFQIEEKEKATNPGQFTPHPLMSENENKVYIVFGKLLLFVIRLTSSVLVKCGSFLVHCNPH